MGSLPVRDLLPRLRRLTIAVAVVAITLQWVNTRVAILQINQNPAHPIDAYDTYSIYHSMATGLREGRIGQIDLAAAQRYSSLHDSRRPCTSDCRPTPSTSGSTTTRSTSAIRSSSRPRGWRFRRCPTTTCGHWRCSCVVDAAARGLRVLRVLALEPVARTAGGVSVLVQLAVFFELVSFAFYYYWDIPLTFVVLGALHPGLSASGGNGALADPRGAGARVRRVAARIVVAAVAVPVRASPLCTPALRRSAGRRRSSLFAILATPQVVRSSLARGHLTLTTRAVWHVALVGLGYYPNPYGLEANDEADLQADQGQVRRRLSASEDY